MNLAGAIDSADNDALTTASLNADRHARHYVPQKRDAPGDFPGIVS
jgi:hypothetical protein